MPSSQDATDHKGTLPGELAEQRISHAPSVMGLFLAFLRLGATSFGGPSMVAYIRRMAVESRYPLGGFDRDSDFRRDATSRILGLMRYE